jgi:hypothetical protein
MGAACRSFADAGTLPSHAAKARPFHAGDYEPRTEGASC